MPIRTYSSPAPQRPTQIGVAALGLVSLGLTALLPSAARAQTQDLFVSNGNNSTISRFAGTGPGTFSTTPTTLNVPSVYVAQGQPDGLAFDASGDLFAANYADYSITKFAAGTTPGTFGATTTLPGLTGGFLDRPTGLAVDGSGNLFAANFNSGMITVLAANYFTGPISAPLSDPGLNSPEGLALDARGDLFAANYFGNSITEFSPGATPGTFGATTTLTGGGLNHPIGLAVDARGDLFAASGNSITEFAVNPFTGAVGTTGVQVVSGLIFPFSLRFPAGLAFDARGDLFVVNSGSNSVAEFAFNPAGYGGLGAFGPAQTVETGLNGPTFLAFGPSAPPSVPEASTTVSLGLLLALGMGGMVVAARKKRKA